MARTKSTAKPTTTPDPAPQVIELEQAEFHAILQRLQELGAAASDLSKLSMLLAAYVYMMQLIASYKMSIKRLRNIVFGPKTEKTSNVVPPIDPPPVPPASDSDTSDGDTTDGGTLDASDADTSDGDTTDADPTDLGTTDPAGAATPAQVSPVSPESPGAHEAADLVGPDRTGIFTSGIVSITPEGHRIVLFFTGRQHAGENLRDVLMHRTDGLEPPIQMCDALSRNRHSAAAAAC